MAKRPSRYGNPDGPRPVLVLGLVLGAGLLLLAWHTFPSVHTLWEVPVGLGLFVMSLGKMSAR